jgi:hypothetical protein
MPRRPVSFPNIINKIGLPQDIELIYLWHAWLHNAVQLDAFRIHVS